MEEINNIPAQPLDLSDRQKGLQTENLKPIGLNDISVLESEMNSLYTGVGVRDISSSGLIELRGSDVLDFLHRISTNNIKILLKGEVTKTIFTTEKGRIIDAAVVLNLDDYQLLVCSQEHHEKLIFWLKKYVISDDVKLSNINGKYTLFEVLGPQTDSFMTLINGSIVNNIQPNSIKVINTDGIIFFLMKHFDYNGQLIYWILADPTYAQKLIRYMVENKGPFDFNLIGDEAYNLYRVENGIPAAPNEINDLNNPYELALTTLINNNKGCYIGQEVIARLDTYDKVQKHFCGFVLSVPTDEDKKFTLFTYSNIEAGKITSTVNSFKFNKTIGVGFVKRDSFEEGKILSARGEDGSEQSVTVKKLPMKK